MTRKTAAQAAALYETVRTHIEGGKSTEDACKEAGVSTGAYYNWKKKQLNGGSSEVSLRAEYDKLLESSRVVVEENQRLRKMLGDILVQRELGK